VSANEKREGKSVSLHYIPIEAPHLIALSKLLEKPRGERRYHWLIVDVFLLCLLSFHFKFSICDI